MSDSESLSSTDDSYYDPCDRCKSDMHCINQDGLKICEICWSLFCNGLRDFKFAYTKCQLCEKKEKMTNGLVCLKCHAGNKAISIKCENCKKKYHYDQRINCPNCRYDVNGYIIEKQPNDGQ